MTNDATIPLFPCKSVPDTLDFYRALGFEVTHEQSEPYPYGAVQRHGVDLHFTPRLSLHGARNAFGACLVLVDEVQTAHRGFGDGLRELYGRIPTAGVPRITRFGRTRTRFTVFDPSGNMITYIERGEPDADYGSVPEGLSALAEELEKAVFLRDTYANDEAAAKVLDKALERHQAADPVDRARALAARAELALALGDTERARAVGLQLKDTHLPAEARRRLAEELRAARDLERWITGGGPSPER